MSPREIKGESKPADNDIGYVPWWEWREGKRPPGWTASDERRWRGQGGDPNWKARPKAPKPASPNPHIEPELQRLLDRIDEREALQAKRGLMNTELAPTLELYKALQAGEAVPIELLNPDAVKRYGLRNRGAA